MTGRGRHLTAPLVALCLLAASGLQAAPQRGRHPVSRRVPAASESKAPDPANAGRVADIRFWTQADATRIAVEVTSAYKMKSDRLQNPDRLFFDIVGIKPQAGKPMQTISVGDPRVRQIRVAETQPGTTRLVLDLSSAVDFDASQLTNPERLIIEIRPHGAARKQPAAEPPVESARKRFVPPVAPARVPAAPAEIDVVPPRLTTHMEAPVLPTPRIKVPPPSSSRETLRASIVREATPRRDASAAVIGPTSPAPEPAAPVAETTPREVAARATPLPAAPRHPPNTPALPAKKNAAGEESLTRALGLKLGRVVIDAGHGGHDAGTHGPGGLLEKDLVLDIAKRLAVLVQTRMGSEVILTRDDDTFIQLEQRPRIANDARADLFISIHANSSPVKTISGVETYYLNFTPSRTAMEVAARENATAESSIADLRDIVQKIALKEKIDESREFAGRVQASMAALSTRNAGSKDRGVKKAPFIVLIGAQMPAILAEVGFVTNVRDEQMMRKPEYRQRIADALCRGIQQYASGLSHFQVAQRSKTVASE